MSSSALRTPIALTSPQYCEDCQHFVKHPDDVRLSKCAAHPIYPKLYISRESVEYESCCTIREYYARELSQGPGFCLEFVASTGPSDPAAAVADSSTAANASRQNTEDACK